MANGYLYACKAEITEAIKGAKNRNEIMKRIQNCGYFPSDETDEYGYVNIKICFPNDEYVRVYINSRKEVIVQVWEKYEFKYSGIPTFNPSGVNSGGLFDRMIG